MLVTEAEIERFQRDGAILLRNVFSKQWIETAKAGIERNQARPSQYSERLGGPGGEAAYFNDYCNWQTIEQFRDFAFNSPAAEIAARLMRSRYSVFYHEHVLNKEAGAEKETPWHQDQPYYPIDGSRLVSIWLPVDPVPPSSALQFVAGSHRWGRWFHPRKFASSQNYPLAEGMDETALTTRRYEDVPVAEIESGQHEVISWACQPGDCVVFHGLTLHGARGNSTGTDRRVLSTRWCGQGTVLAARPWTVSPPELGGLGWGDPVLSDTFPLIWGQV